MNNTEDTGKYESVLRCKFRRALNEHYGGDVVDTLIDILREDYILVRKEHRSCKDCISCHQDHEWTITTVPYYCKKYQFAIKNLSTAEDCKGFFGAAEEARKSIAHLHKELNPESLFYE